MTKTDDHNQKPLNVLHIITGLRFGGAEKLLYLTCKYLQRGYESRVKIVYFDPYAPMKKLFDEAGLMTELIPINLLIIPRLIRLIAEGNYQIIHTHLIHADIIGRTAAICTRLFHKYQIFTTVHDVGLFRWYPRFFFRIVRCIDRMQSCPRYSHVIAISQSVREILILNEHIKSHKIEVLYNAVEIPETLTRKNETGVKIRCLYIGRLVKEKNLPCLLEAMLLLREEPVELTIVGEGTEEESLKALAGTLGISGSVQFVPATLETGQYYSSHDVFILPSSLEGLGIVILEAFGFGLPVIGSNVHGIRELLAENRGLLFDVNDARGLATQIETLVTNPQLRIEYGRRGHDYVIKNHDICVYVRRLHDIYHLALVANGKQILQ